MQVILMEKVVNLGNLGDVVKVRDGYARNFLIPQGKAKRVTPENLAEFETRRAELERQQAEKLSGAQEKAAKLEGLMVQITRKAGVDGRLFGSVTAQHLSAALAEQLGVEADKRIIEMPDEVKELGNYEATVKFHPEVHAAVKFEVAAEGAGEE